MTFRVRTALAQNNETRSVHSLTSVSRSRLKNRLSSSKLSGDTFSLSQDEKRRSFKNKNECSDVALHRLVAHRRDEVRLDQRVEMRDFRILPLQKLDVLDELK